ncbi:23S rRNA (guanosine2251-2'-O)-methyltransferase [Geothermobacter ehrlichii]|uniref:23S rRNA (Guanosine2251-2'-O)-methyltransferase n=1 Tax=Geothermobacter ehrlichii TaxID=213224 RepID=A0A5D3WF71_9BACT|nr:23S rRNA (guanosine(2251)-2'-O)-methyltransferase RlmB [Geothermobacter ehrlichii]TYO96301.1 23S rRNA (guanosine2251-2'-O)-methyltransferase [Geothermobacter ehrlichii]
MADLVCGINPVREALSGGMRRALRLLVAEGGKNRRIEPLLRLAEERGVSVGRRPRGELDRLCGGLRHQDVVLLLEPFRYCPFEDLLDRWRASGRHAFFLLLDGVTDPHNLGAIARSAEVAGCHGLILPRDRSCPVTAVAERAAAGALNHLPVCRVTNLARTMDELRRQGIWLYGLAGEDEAVNLFEVDLGGDVALVVGAEGRGLRPNIRGRCDRLLAIPMFGRVSSLNASVAAGIALFEVVRQKFRDG